MGSQVITDLYLAGINYARGCTPYARQTNHFVAEVVKLSYIILAEAGEIGFVSELQVSKCNTPDTLTRNPISLMNSNPNTNIHKYECLKLQLMTSFAYLYLATSSYPLHMCASTPNLTMASLGDFSKVRVGI
jgi:hypothetical protein